MVYANALRAFGCKSLGVRVPLLLLFDCKDIMDKEDKWNGKNGIIVDILEYVNQRSLREPEFAKAWEEESNRRIEMMKNRKKLRCSFCKPNKGENKKRKPKHGKAKRKKT